MKVIFAAEAALDLEHIGDYIAVHNPVRAESFVRELMARLITRSEAPALA